MSANSVVNVDRSDIADLLDISIEQFQIAMYQLEKFRLFPYPNGAGPTYKQAIYDRAQVQEWVDSFPILVENDKYDWLDRIGLYPTPELVRDSVAPPEFKEHDEFVAAIKVASLYDMSEAGLQSLLKMNFGDETVLSRVPDHFRYGLMIQPYYWKSELDWFFDAVADWEEKTGMNKWDMTTKDVNDYLDSKSNLIYDYRYFRYHEDFAFPLSRKLSTVRCDALWCRNEIDTWVDSLPLDFVAAHRLEQQHLKNGVPKKTPGQIRPSVATIKIDDDKPLKVRELTRELGYLTGSAIMRRRRRTNFSGVRRRVFRDPIRFNKSYDPSFPNPMLLPNGKTILYWKSEMIEWAMINRKECKLVADYEWVRLPD